MLYIQYHPVSSTRNTVTNFMGRDDYPDKVGSSESLSDCLAAQDMVYILHADVTNLRGSSTQSYNLSLLLVAILVGH